LEFNVPFQHKYGYIRDDVIGGNVAKVVDSTSSEGFLAFRYDFDHSQFANY